MPPITGFVLDFREQGGDATGFDTNVYTPGANKTILIISSGVGLVSPPPVIPSASGNGLAWSLVASQLFDFLGVDRARLTVHRGLGASPTQGVTRIQYTATQFRQALLVLEFANTDIGLLGAEAIVGSPVSKKEITGSGINPSVTMPAAEDQANAILGLFGYSEPNPLIVPGIGFVILKNVPTAEGGGHAVEFRQAPQTTVDWNLGDDTATRALMGIELRNATPTVAEAAAQVQGRPSFISGNLITP